MKGIELILSPIGMMMRLMLSHELGATHIERCKDHGVVTGEVTLSLEESNLHAMTIDTTATLVPVWRGSGAGGGETLVVLMANAGLPNSLSINIPGLKWVEKTVPVFTPSGLDVVMILRIGAKYIANTLLNIGAPT